jgi:hypothetical protein
MGNFMPFAIVSASRPSRAVLTPQNDWSVLGPAAAELQTIAYQRVLNSTRVDQETLSLGVRWDLHSRAALKLQWDRTRIHPQGYAAWFRPYEIRQSTTRVDVLTMSLDFVF